MVATFKGANFEDKVFQEEVSERRDGQTSASGRPVGAGREAGDGASRALGVRGRRRTSLYTRIRSHPVVREVTCRASDDVAGLRVEDERL